MPPLPKFRTSQTRTGTRAIPREAPLPEAAPLPPGAADVAAGAIGLGKAAIGKGIGDIGEFLFKFAQIKQQERDTADYWKGLGEYQAANNEYFANLREGKITDANGISITPDKYVESYTAVTNQQGDILSDKSTKAQQRLKNYFAFHDPINLAKIDDIAFRLRQSEDLAALDTTIDAKLEAAANAEHPLEAKAFIAEIDQMLKENTPQLITATTAKRMSDDVERRFKIAVHDAAVNRVHAAIEANQFKVAGELANNPLIPEKEQTTLRSAIRTEKKRLQIKADEDLKERQNETARNLLVSLWDGTLTDTILRDATEAGLLTYEKAKGLRLALTKPKEFNLTAYIKVKNAVNSYEQGAVSFDDALDVLIENASLLGDQGKGLTDKLFAMPNKNEADWEKEALDYIESQILEKDIFGRFYGTPKEQAAALEARLAYDVALETAERKGEPIEGRDKLIKAHEIMLKYRPEKEEKPPVELEKGLGTIPFISDADIDKAIKQARENLGEKATPQEIKAEALRLLR